MTRKREVVEVALTLTAQRPVAMSKDDWRRFRSEVESLFTCAGWSNIATEQCLRHSWVVVKGGRNHERAGRTVA